jgi:alpha-L-arabinofuranosidase
MCDKRNVVSRIIAALSLIVFASTNMTLHADEARRIVIDPKQAGEEISPQLFGHNVEITRQGVWRGLGAEMVANRKFAAVQNGMPKRWIPINNGGRVAIDDSVGYAGKRSARIEVLEAGKSCGIAQAHESIAFLKDTKYSLRMWLKSDADRTVKVRVIDASGSRGVFESEWSAKSGDWQLLSGEFVASVTSENNRLEFISQEIGIFWIGAVSVQPTNAFHGMRRDVIELLKRIKPGSLRYPGGCYAEFYQWQEGLLPVDQRPPIGPTGLGFLLPDNDDYDPHEIGVDEFIALCREIGSEPAFTVRMSEKTPEDAAALVEYCNGGPDTKWGKVRAQHGHSSPHQIRTWFVGNELYSFGRGGLNKADFCAIQTKQFAEAMKKVDPTIQLVGCTNDPNWNKALVKQGGDMLDLYSLHNYMGYLNNDLSALAKAPIQILRPWFQSFRDSIRKEIPSGRSFGITFDEWNTMWGQKGSAGMGVYVAAVLHLLCREAVPLQIERAYYFMPVNEGAIQVTPLGASLDTAGQVFDLFKVHQGNRLLNTSPALSDSDDLDLCASLTSDGKYIYVTVINRNITNEVMLELSLRNFSGPTDVPAKLLVPLKLDAESKSKFVEQEEKLQVIDGKLVLKMPPCSIARVCLGKSCD